MKPRVSMVLAVALFCGALMAADAVPPPPAAADPATGIVKLTRKCPVCKGKGKLVLTPPDHGQHRGAIESKRHWDVKLDCPICEGCGLLRIYRTVIDKPLEAVPPCRTCGWTGVEKCRACNASGVQPCRNAGCRNGWIVEDVTTGGGKYANRNKKKKVTACPVCQGVGKVKCPSCKGMQGAPCHTCQGLGKKVKP